jgi:hypothetical protein
MEYTAIYIAVKLQELRGWHWRLSDGATAGIGTIVAVDAWQNQTGLGGGSDMSRHLQTRLVSILAGNQ